MLKRILARTLSVLMSLSMFACGNAATETEPVETEPTFTQPGEEGKVLKVLVLGHSLAVDTGHMLSMIAAAEGYESLKLGTLYYSGCELWRHVQYLQADSPEYRLYVSSTDEPNVPPTTMDSVTMKQAIKFDYWDIIVMQGGAFEIGQDEAFKNGNIQIVQDYVNEHKLNPTAIFAWHMAWALPTNNTLRDKYPYENNPYYGTYQKLFNEDRATMYNAVTSCVRDNIMTDDTFEFMIPCGTAMENALSSYWEETDIHRDYAHATDLARVMTSYVWYCRLTGIDQLEEIKLDAIPKKFFKSMTAAEDYVLTEMDKNIILESVNNALANPLKMTQSQYTVAP